MDPTSDLHRSLSSHRSSSGSGRLPDPSLSFSTTRSSSPFSTRPSSSLRNSRSGDALYSTPTSREPFSSTGSGSGLDASALGSRSTSGIEGANLSGTPLRTSSLPPTSSMRSTSTTPGLREVETREIMQAEESVALLKQHAAQVQHLRAEAERKDMLVENLKKELESSRSFRDEALQARSELAVLDEKCRLREEEIRRISHQLDNAREEGETQVRQLRIQLESTDQELSELQRRFREESEELRRRIRELEQDRNEHVNTIQRQDAELQSVVRSSRMQQDSFEERDSSHRIEMHRAQDSITKLNATVTTQEDQIIRLREEMNRLRQALQEGDSVVHKLQLELKKEDDASEELKRANKSLRADFAQLEERFHAVELQANLVPELRKEASMIPSLRSDVQALRTECSELEETLIRERKNKEMIENEKYRVEELNAELERHIQDLTNRYAGITSPNSELREKKKQVDFLSAEVEQQRTHIARLRDELAHANDDNRELLRRLESSASDASVEIGNLSRQVELVLSGHEPNEEALKSFSPSRLIHLETVRNSLIGMKDRLFDSLSELHLNRERIIVLQRDLDVQISITQTKEAERSDCHRELMSARKNLMEMEINLRETSERLRSAEDEKSDLKTRILQLEDQSSERIDFLGSLVRQLGEKSREIRSPSRSLLSPVRGSNSWTTIKSALSEEVSNKIMECDSLRRDLNSETAAREDLESKLREVQETLRNTRTAMRDLQVDLERAKQDALENLRHQLETAHSIHLQEQKSRVRNLEEDLSRMQQENANMNVVNRKLNATNEILTHQLHDMREYARRSLSACKLLVRGVRPLRFRLTELRAQKQFLKRQLQDSEKTHSDIVQLVSALSGEFRVESGIESHISSHRSSSRRHTTFRAAVIAVMAANRLVYLFVQSKEFSCRAHAGSERVHIAPPESVLEVDDIPSLPDKSPVAEAEAFVRLIAHFEGTRNPAMLEGLTMHASPMEDGEIHSFELLARLQQGQKEFSWHLSRLRQLDRAESSENPASSYLSMERGVAYIRKQTVSISRRLREVERDRSALKRECIELQDECGRLNKVFLELQDTISVTKDANRSLERDVESLRAELSRMISPERHEKVLRELETLEKTLSAVKDERTALRRDLEDRMSCIQDLRQDLQVAEERFREKSREKDALERELLRRTEESANLQAYTKDRTQEVIQLDEKIREAEDVVSSLRESVARAESESKSLKAHIAAIETDLLQERRFSSTLQRRVEDLETSVQDARMVESRLRDEVRRLESELSGSRSLLDRVSTECDRDRGRAQELERKLAEQSAQLQSTENQLQLIRQQELLEDREKEEWLRVRMETMNRRSEAERQLNNVLEAASSSSSVHPTPTARATPSRMRYSFSSSSDRESTTLHDSLRSETVSRESTRGSVSQASPSKAFSLTGTGSRSSLSGISNPYSNAYSLRGSSNSYL